MARNEVREEYLEWSALPRRTKMVHRMPLTDKDFAAEKGPWADADGRCDAPMAALLANRANDRAARPTAREARGTYGPSES